MFNDVYELFCWFGECPDRFNYYYYVYGSVGRTDLIQRNGDVYTLIGDVFGTIVVKKGGITIDGAGYAIKGMGAGIDLRQNSMAIPPAYDNVVVKNVRFCDNSYVFTSSCGNSFINNTFEGGGIWTVGNTDGDAVNVIKHNVFINATSGVFVDYTGLWDNIICASFLLHLCLPNSLGSIIV
jgi:hypothetical protein